MRAAWLALALVSVAAGQAVAQAPDPLAELRISSSQQAVDASAGSRCRMHTRPDGTGTGGCGDFAHPLELHGHLPVRAGKLIAFDFGAPVNRVDASLAYGSSHVPVELHPDGDAPSKRWLATLPEGTHTGDPLLSVLAFYDPPANPSGDQHWEAGLHVMPPVRMTGRVRMPRLTGRALPAAKAALEWRGLRWRVDGGPVETDSGPLADGEPPTITRQRPARGRRVLRGRVVRLRTD